MRVLKVRIKKIENKFNNNTIYQHKFIPPKNWQIVRASSQIFLFFQTARIENLKISMLLVKIEIFVSNPPRQEGHKFTLFTVLYNAVEK